MNGEPVDAGTEDVAPTIEELLAEHLDDLRLFLSAHMGRRLREREESSDLLQSVCRHVLEARDGFLFEGGAEFRRWLYSTARNKLTDRRRYHGAARRDGRREIRQSSGSGVSRQPTSPHMTPSEHVAAREGCSRIVEALRELPAEKRRVILLSRLGGLSHAELARRLGRTEGAVRTLLYRTLARLSHLLDRDDEGDASP